MNMLEKINISATIISRQNLREARKQVFDKSDRFIGILIESK